MQLNPKPIIVGLDIGTTKVVAIAGRKNEFGKLELLGFGEAESAGVSHGVVMNIEQCIQSIELAISRCMESNPDLDIRDVYVGIAGQHIKSFQTRGDRVRTNIEDEISKADIDLLIRDQYKTYIPAGDRIIDIIPQEYTVDNTPYVLDPIGMSGVKIGASFHVITGDRNAIRNIQRCVDKSHLITKDLVLQPLASAAAVMNEEDLEAGVAILDIGGGTTDLAVFYDGMLKHTAVIPYAGVNVTQDIRGGLGVLRTQAELLKTHYGVALADEASERDFIEIPGLRGLPSKEISVKMLAHIIQARMDEILDYVVYHLKQVDLDKKLYGGIILTGGGSQLKHLIQLTEYKTGLMARMGYPSEHLAASTQLEKINNPKYATCIGLILRGYYDWESGRPRFINEVPQINTNDTVIIPPPTVPDAPVSSEDSFLEDPINVRPRRERFKNLFDGMKERIMKIFEDEPDQEL
ncbi:MAG: cell division protein FtsA [Sphingobacteriales bacterium]|nr:MAG: cell division protein FtsA [Sphingobacteriales bacterium]